MAGAGYKSWTTGDLVSASQMNTYIQEQTVMVFADASARSTAITVPSEGMVTYLSDIDQLQFYSGTAWKAVSMPQVVNGREWGSSFGAKYHARLGAQETLYGSATPGLLFDGNSGWLKNGTLTRITNAPTIAGTGDINSASDYAAYRVSLTAGAGAYFASPQVVGGWEQIQVATKILGSAPTTITVGMIANANVTTADAADGFGITNDEDAAVGTAGVIAIINGATNFEYRIGTAAGVSLGVAKDTNAHLWEFVINIGALTMDIKIDGTVRASAVSLANDEWPKSLFCRAITAVRWEHSFWWVYYD